MTPEVAAQGPRFEVVRFSEGSETAWIPIFFRGVVDRPRLMPQGVRRRRDFCVAWLRWTLTLVRDV